MNSVNLIGRSTKDPEVRVTNGGMTIATFTLAIDRPVKQGLDKQTDFPKVTCFGKTAEIVEQYVKKGGQVGVTGRLQTGSYQNKEGQTVYTTDVVADRVDLIGGKASASNHSESNPPAFQQMDATEVPF